METKKVFEETGKLGNEISSLERRLESIIEKCYEVMEICPHELVFKYNDNIPRLMIIDGNYYCPACGKNMRFYKKGDIEQTDFRNARVIKLTRISLVGTSNLLHKIRNEVYQNMDIYYNSELDESELAERMLEVVKDEEQVYEEPVVKIRKRSKNTRK